MIDVVAGDIYQYYKGDLYKVLHIGEYEADLRKMVVYAAVDKPERVWIRDLDIFTETVTWDGTVQPRFKEVADSQS